MKLYLAVQGPRGLAKCKECSSGLRLDSVTTGVLGLACDNAVSWRL